MLITDNSIKNLFKKNIHQLTCFQSQDTNCIFHWENLPFPRHFPSFQHVLLPSLPTLTFPPCNALTSYTWCSTFLFVSTSSLQQWINFTAHNRRRRARCRTLSDKLTVVKGSERFEKYFCDKNCPVTKRNLERKTVKWKAFWKKVKRLSDLNFL